MIAVRTTLPSSLFCTSFNFSLAAVALEFDDSLLHFDCLVLKAALLALHQRRLTTLSGTSSSHEGDVCHLISPEVARRHLTAH
jgi:hypothetical protein